MFSCLLLHSGSPADPVPATRCQSQFRAVGNIAHGAVSLQFDPPRELTESVLYVPNLCLRRAIGRTRLRVTACTITNGSSKATLRLCGARGMDDPRLQKLKITNSVVKKRYCKAVSHWAGVQSIDDFVVHIGPVHRQTRLVVELEFLLLIEPQTDKGGVYCTYGCMLPASSHTLDVTLYQSSKVESFTSSFEPEGATKPILSEGSAEDGTALHFYGSVSDYSLEEPFGITLLLQSTSYCTPTAEVVSLLLPEPYPVKMAPTNEDGGHVLDTIDGLMLMNCAMSKPTACFERRSPELYPCDFVFLVDCSGSMSGLKIQMASETLILSLKSLPAGCCFNIIAFGSKYYHLFPSSEELSEKTLEKGVQFCNQLKACLGGTELLNPIRWLLRRPPANELSRQVFLITDGGAPNYHAVLQTVRRHRESTQFHTFGLGQEVCPELIAGVAAATGGSSVMVEKGERLQAHVISVLTSSLYPHLTDATPQWSPPEGYSLVEAVPAGSMGTIFSGNSSMALAFLRKKSDTIDRNNHAQHVPALSSLCGNVRGERVDIPESPSLEITDHSSSQAAEFLLKAAAFVKINSLEQEMRARQSKRPQFHHEEVSGEPPTKRVRMNGMCHSKVNHKESSANDELLCYSHSFGIPCCLAYLQSSPDDDSAPVVILPEHSTTPKLCAPAESQQSTPLLSKKASATKIERKRKHSNTSTLTSLTSSLASLAHETVSTLGGVMKTAISVTTMGLVNIEDAKEESDETGEGIEDQVYHDQQHSRIHWDSHHQLVFPSFYYQSHHSNHQNGEAHHEKAFENSGKLPGESSAPTSANHHAIPNSSVALSNGLTSPEPSYFPVSPDLVLTTPTNYYPIVLLQLFSGGWSLSQPLCHAIGVPMREFLALPLCNVPTSNHVGSTNRGYGQEGHFWATLVAISCLRELFGERKNEWGLVAFKGELWLEEHKDKHPLSIYRAWETSKDLIHKIHS